MKIVFRCILALALGAGHSAYAQTSDSQTQSTDSRQGANTAKELPESQPTKGNLDAYIPDKPAASDSSRLTQWCKTPVGYCDIGQMTEPGEDCYCRLQSGKKSNGKTSYRAGKE